MFRFFFGKGKNQLDRLRQTVSPYGLKYERAHFLPAHFSEIAGGLKPAPANQITVLFQIEPLFCKTEAFFMNKILSASNIF